MGIDVRVKSNMKPTELNVERVKLERDLRSCMRCKFFYNSSLCAKYKCVEEEEQKKQPERPAKCIGCPYGKGNYLPCWRELLGQIKEEK